MHFGDNDGVRFSLVKASAAGTIAQKRVMYLYICVHTLDPEISVSGPWPFCFKFPLICLILHGHSTSPRTASWSSGLCPVILHPEISVSYWHLSSFLVGLFAGLVISFVTFFGFKLWM